MTAIPAARKPSGAPDIKEDPRWSGVRSVRVEPVSVVDLDELWTTNDVAEHCNVSEGAVRYWRQTNTGPPYAKLGRLVRYRPSDVRAWLDQQFESDRQAVPLIGK
ncbi:Excisionase (modular protein) [Frankia canadensis]|uniref:Excisionase (Modular protein) n=1 Tax=Frankia canadensis TaxID=1836972 RepID=A0A2I2KN64_9ACTN|nr:helix-turn-helix domain-containing protein [Frankia canadensis]SNQ47089.1 Excisionase (modular protein) [Frankia canadensis]SOU54379.1 Excisionase (modular protein) [Frankia canadensis]